VESVNYKKEIPMNDDEVTIMIDELLKHCSSVAIGALRHVGETNETLIEHAWTSNISLLKWARFENAHKKANILVRPKHSTPHPWLFLDDLSFVKADALSDRYQSIIVETSHQNFQARLLADRDLSEFDRHNVQSKLALLINADLGSTAGSKFGRLPGFRNKKDGKNGFMTRLAALPDDTLPKFNPYPYLLLPPKVGGCVSKVFVEKSHSGEVDESAIEFGYIYNRLCVFKNKGYDYLVEAKRLELDLIERCRARKSNPVDYARRTLKAVLIRI
jgi:hypothetical protein